MTFGNSVKMNLGKENGTTEFKESLGQLDKGIRSLSAMLNRHRGGTVYFGVDDDGNVIGLDVGNNSLETVRNAVHSLIKPQITPIIREHTTDDGKRYISLSATGVSIPYSFDGRYYVRNVSSDEQAEPEVVIQLVLSRGIDPLKDQASDVQDLTFDLLFTLMLSKGMHPRNDGLFFKSQKMITEQGEFNLTAYLVSDQNTIPMQVVRFDGKDRTGMSSRVNFGNQSLIGSMNDVLKHVSSFMITKVDLSKGERMETDLFDLESFREAWFNACVHNAWRGMIPPSVLMFDDRIEIVSYGRIPFPLSTDSFYQGDSRPVNSELFHIFSELGFMEQSGHGVPIIVKRYGKEAFEITESGVTVTIPFAFEPEYISSKKENLINSLNIDEKEKLALSILFENPEMKLNDLSERMGISLSSVKKMVAGLKEKGLLKNEGTNRQSRWVVSIKNGSVDGMLLEQ